MLLRMVFTCINLEFDDNWEMSIIPNEFDTETSSKSKSIFMSTKLETEISPSFDDRVNLMYKKYKRSLGKIEKMKYDNIEKMKENCTFKPIITNYLSRHKSKKRKNSAGERHKKIITCEEKELSYCTFRPKILHR